MKHGKKYIESAKSFDNQKLYDPEEGISVVLSTAKAKFDETIEAHIRLGVDSRHADQQVRGAVVLPHGTGKVVRVLVFAKGDKAREAQEAGADFVKTSTGFSTSGATVEDVRLMKQTVGDVCQVKAAGGVRCFDDLKAMIEAGADRIGTSSGVALLAGQEATGY